MVKKTSSLQNLSCKILQDIAFSCKRSCKIVESETITLQNYFKTIRQHGWKLLNKFWTRRDFFLMRKTLCCEQFFGEILVFFHFFEILDSKFPDHLFAANLHSATYFTNHCYGKTLAAYVAQLGWTYGQTQKRQAYSSVRLNFRPNCLKISK